MNKNITKIREFVAKEFKITVTKLSDDDVIKLAKFALLAMELELPMMAKDNRNSLGL